MGRDGAFSGCLCGSGAGAGAGMLACGAALGAGSDWLLLVAIWAFSSAGFSAVGASFSGLNRFSSAAPPASAPKPDTALMPCAHGLFQAACVVGQCGAVAWGGSVVTRSGNLCQCSLNARRGSVGIMTRIARFHPHGFFPREFVDVFIQTRGGAFSSGSLSYGLFLNESGDSTFSAMHQKFWSAT